MLSRFTTSKNQTAAVFINRFPSADDCLENELTRRAIKVFTNPAIFSIFICEFFNKNNEND